MAAKYETTVELPSNGKLYEESIGKITLRAMTTAEEKLLLGSTSDDSFDKILSNCIVSPKGIDLSSLIASDKHFLILKLRTHTYGSEYNVTSRCTECGAKLDLQLDLDAFPIYELDDEFSEPISIELPVSGDKLECRLLRDNDLKSVKTRAKKLSKTLRKPVKELEYDLRMAKYILSINGDEIEDLADSQKYVQTMHGRDSAYFWHVLGEVKIGYDTTIEAECTECGCDFETVMPISSEFFRPRFK